jgi:hypothetical protein
MFPFIFEWKWNADHYIFLGLLYLALIIIGGGLLYTLAKTWLDFPQHEERFEPPEKIEYRSRYSQY